MLVATNINDAQPFKHSPLHLRSQPSSKGVPASGFRVATTLGRVHALLRSDPKHNTRLRDVTSEYSHVLPFNCPSKHSVPDWHLLAIA